MVPLVGSEIVYRGTNQGQNSPTLNENTENDIDPASNVKQALEDKFGPNHALIEVARCESGYRQFNEDGSVLRGKQNPKDVGALQINEYYHLDRAKELGIDIYTLEGNMEYGRVLYEEQGTTPWNWSKKCWGK